MEWSLDFISEEDFKNHVRATIMKYGEKLESYDLKRFNSNRDCEKKSVNKILL